MQVQQGHKVQVHYTGKLNNGELFDTSEGKEPLEFTVGQGMVIPGFDNALLDMKVGDKKTVNIPVDQAYGPVQEDMIIQFPKTEVPSDVAPQVGQEFQLTDDQGNIIPVIVIDITSEHVIMDANHPLAGQELNFDIELVGIM
jgi:FKBP-type peptidyl-prolyl cis-trans isomerase 2